MRNCLKLKKEKNYTRKNKETQGAGVSAYADTRREATDCQGD